ncbi:MAG: 30S ribosomal protein S16 [Candidatus Eremiobacteraeota bacterium]|nr:30S ribosomal protein S16 [Candidatus Eremiobacteraeota bacterium]
MVKIRLRRMGAKKQPTYRFVVADSKSPRDGRFIEILGHYNPRTEPKTLEVDADKAKEWLSKGAQPTETVKRLFAEKGIVERGPIPTHKRKPKSEGKAK